jgi:hypothetical protein
MYNNVFVCNVSINLLTLLLLVASSLSIILLSIETHEAAFARCPDGDCEKVTVSSSSSSSSSGDSSIVIII